MLEAIYPFIMKKLIFFSFILIAACTASKENISPKVHSTSDITELNQILDLTIDSMFVESSNLPSSFYPEILSTNPEYYWKYLINPDYPSTPDSIYNMALDEVRRDFENGNYIFKNYGLETILTLEDGSKWNPKRVYSEKDKAPSTRMAVAGLLRETLMSVQDYKVKKENANKNSEPFSRDIKMESLLRILDREIPLKVHAHRADDIITAIRIADEFAIEITLEHCTEGHKVVDEIKEAGLNCIVGPTLTGRVKVELRELNFKTAGVLASAGVKVALMSDHPVIPTYGLPLYAALAFKSGMNPIEALKAITINPAQILGVDDRIGSLKTGKDADIVVFSGDPLDVRSQVEKVIINGELVKE